MVTPAMPFVGAEPRQISIDRSETQVLVSIAQLLTEVLAELKHMNNAERTGAISSVEVKFLANGTPQPTVKVYAGSAVPVDEAIEAYGRAFLMAQQGHMEGWEQTIDVLQKSSAA